MLQGKALHKVKAGQTVVSVCGPSDFPQPGLCARIGVVMGTEDSRWGTNLLVKWNDGSDDKIQTLYTQGERGIGVYAYPVIAE